MVLIKRNIDVAYKSIDKYQIRDNADLIQDGLLDESGATLKRPGTELWFDLSAINSKYSNKSIDGIFWAAEIKAVFVCCDTDIIKFTDKFANYTLIGSGVLQGGPKVTFTKVADGDNSNATTYFFANGGQVAYTTGGTVANFPTGVTGSPPTKVTHVSSLDRYLFMNDLDNLKNWYSSDAATPLNFTGAIEYSAEAKTDDILGIYQNAGVMWVQGEDSLEPFYDAGSTPPFLKILGGLVETGTANPYSIGLFNKTAIFLNSNRDVVTLSGYTPITLSAPYASRIQELSSVVDVEVDVYQNVEGRSFAIFNFNDASISFVYDITLKQRTNKDSFYEWGKWVSNNNSYDQFPYRGHAYAQTWNMHLVGDRDSGKIYQMSFEFTDDAGDPIRTEEITGIYGHPVQQTESKNIFFDFRRGDGLTGDKYDEGSVFVSFRDDRSDHWSNPTEYKLGKVGQSELNALVQAGGTYYTRQYRIVHQDSSKFALLGIYEDIDNGKS